MANFPRPLHLAHGFNKRCTSAICLKDDREKWSLAEVKNKKNKTKERENSTFQSAFAFTRRQMTLYSPALPDLFVSSSVSSLPQCEWLEDLGCERKPGRQNELGDAPWLVACSLSDLFMSNQQIWEWWAGPAQLARCGLARTCCIDNMWRFVSVSESLRWNEWSAKGEWLQNDEWDKMWCK